MYETLFKRPSVLARYRDGPHAEARKRYLKQCAVQGYSHAMLQKIAWVLLSIAHCIDIDRGKVTARDIELAVDDRVRFRRPPKYALNFQSSRQLFVHIATDWVRSLGCFNPPSDAESPFVAQLAAFARYLREERGLSPTNISARCKRMV